MVATGTEKDGGVCLHLLLRLNEYGQKKEEERGSISAALTQEHGPQPTLS